MRFKVLLEWDGETGVYVATVPALPGCATQGKTKEQALERAKEAIAATIEGLKATGQPVPSGDVDISIAEVVIPALAGYHASREGRCLGPYSEPGSW